MCALAHHVRLCPLAAEARSAERKRDFEYSAGASARLLLAPADTAVQVLADRTVDRRLRATLSLAAKARRADRVALPPEGDMHMTGRFTAIAN